MDTKSSAEENSPHGPAAQLELLGEGRGTVHLTGLWKLDQSLPSADALLGELAGVSNLTHLEFSTQELQAWDSGLVTFISAVIEYCKAYSVEVDQDGLPEGAQGLLRLAYAVPERQGTRRKEKAVSFVEEVGNQFLDLVRSTGEIIEFIGGTTLALGRLLRGKARFRGRDLMLILQEAGANALPIVSLISFLVGVILAYIGLAQLERFGAKIFVADLVALAMVREMAAMMTAIILAGRTGAAFAAQLGTMQVNEEIDALRTTGIPPMEFLVLPRVLALTLMTPLLALYANALGIAGGAFVGTTVGGLTLTEYIQATKTAFDLQDLSSGVIKAAIYGVIVAVAGCLRGMQCGRSAASVGLATTSAVVTAILFIVIASAITTIIYTALGF